MGSIYTQKKRFLAGTKPWNAGTGKPLLEITCVQCGVKVLKRRAAVLRRKQKYCSQQCFVIARDGR